SYRGPAARQEWQATEPGGVGVRGVPCESIGFHSACTLAETARRHNLANECPPMSAQSRLKSYTNFALAVSVSVMENTPPSENAAHVPRFHSPGGPALTAAEIVAGKVIEFARSRRKLVHALAGHFKVEVPDDVERFFDAVESGRWEEVDAAHKALLLSEENLN